MFFLLANDIGMVNSDYVENFTIDKCSGKKYSIHAHHRNGHDYCIETGFLDADGARSYLRSMLRLIQPHTGLRRAHNLYADMEGTDENEN